MLFTSIGTLMYICVRLWCCLTVIVILSDIIARNLPAGLKAGSALHLWQAKFS